MNMDTLVTQNIHISNFLGYFWPKVGHESIECLECMLLENWIRFVEESEHAHCRGVVLYHE